MVKFVIIYGLEINEDADGLKFNGRCFKSITHYHQAFKMSQTGIENDSCYHRDHVEKNPR